MRLPQPEIGRQRSIIFYRKQCSLVQYLAQSWYKLTDRSLGDEDAVQGYSFEGRGGGGGDSCEIHIDGDMFLLVVGVLGMSSK